MKERIGSLLVIVGTALLIFGLLSYTPARGGDEVLGIREWSIRGARHPQWAKATATLGGAILAGGILLLRRQT